MCPGEGCYDRTIEIWIGLCPGTGYNVQHCYSYGTPEQYDWYFTFSDPFSSQKILIFYQKCQWSFPEGPTDISIGVDIDMVLRRQQAIIQNNDEALWGPDVWQGLHHCDVIMSMMASQISSLPIVYAIVYSGTDQRKHQSSASLAFVWGIHRWPVNSPHRGPVTRKMFPFDDIMRCAPRPKSCYLKPISKQDIISYKFSLKDLHKVWLLLSQPYS